jgi:acyl CoA:acetate/3-ketoacid CoA transferase beta subunit
VVTDLGILQPRAGTAELELTQVHPGVTVDQVKAATGWELAVSPEVSVTVPPRDEELAALRRMTAIR